MTNIIATTTINPPTEALIKFSKLQNWSLIIAGDEKTPDEAYRSFEAESTNVLYLSLKDQEKISSDLHELLGYNTLSRRNFSIMQAYKNNADYIAIVDDDNIPLDSWGNIKIDSALECAVYDTNNEAFDPVFVTEHSNLWHRGFPIQLLSERGITSKHIEKFEKKHFSIQANFWNGNPDIDAICRMQYNPKECVFDNASFPFTSKQYSPFNSQNTILSREVIPDYFLFPNIGRMDDIWAAYYVQSLGHKVLYDEASVYQKRNEHNLTKDYEQEHIGVLNTLKLIEDLKIDSKLYFKYLPENSIHIYLTYIKEIIND